MELCVAGIFRYGVTLVDSDLHGHQARTSPITVRMLMHRFHSYHPTNLEADPLLFYAHYSKIGIVPFNLAKTFWAPRILKICHWREVSAKVNFIDNIINFLSKIYDRKNFWVF